MEDRDLHVDHCNQVLQETQSHYSKLAQENGTLKTEMEKLERVMLMQVWLERRRLSSLLYYLEVTTTGIS